MLYKKKKKPVGKKVPIHDLERHPYYVSINLAPLKAVKQKLPYEIPSQSQHHFPIDEIGFRQLTTTKDNFQA